jgi:hypothetical protein
MADSDPVLCAADRRGVATVTLNQPDANNAYNGAPIDNYPSGQNLTLGTGSEGPLIRNSGGSSSLRWRSVVRRFRPFPAIVDNQQDRP